MALYLVKVISALMVASMLCGIVFAFARNSRGRLGSTIVAVGIIASVVVSVVITTIRLVSNVIDVAQMNYLIAEIGLISCAVAIVFAIVRAVGSRSGKKKRLSEDDEASEKRAAGGIAGVSQLVVIAALTLFMGLYIVAQLPDVLRFPFEFNVAKDNLISTDLAVRVIGYLGGLVVVVLIAVAIVKAFRAFESTRSSKTIYGITTALVVAIVASFHLVSVLQIMIRRKVFAVGTDMYTAVFTFTTALSKSTFAFQIVIAAIVIALAVFVIYLSLRDKEPYSNPAEHRKIKARWRNRRRWAICLILCAALSIFTITWLNDYINRGPELSPVEECEVRDGNLYISFEQLEDGHLHRFAYTSDAGVDLGAGSVTKGGNTVRFIIIKKPGSSAYGVGLDACEICGETGYFERDGQVVCKLCDVVMNKNTIGFKGGCNPIPIQYTVENGYIVVPCDELSKYEATFKG